MTSFFLYEGELPMRLMTTYLTALILASPVAAKVREAPPPEPTEHPDWNVVMPQVEEAFRRSMFDPEALRVRWISGFRWTTWREDKGGIWSGGLLNMRRRYGWVACGTINGKNRFGGYVGEEAVYAYVRADGKIAAGPTTEIQGGCDGNGYVEPQPALLKKTDAGQLSVADELQKLWDLRAKGILTQQEFDKQKAKILAR